LAIGRDLKPGDRVAVDAFQRCGSCRYCLSGCGELCDVGSSYSMIPMRVPPAWRADFQPISWQPTRRRSTECRAMCQPDWPHCSTPSAPESSGVST
jgi:hypothetical protein